MSPEWQFLNTQNFETAEKFFRLNGGHIEVLTDGKYTGFIEDEEQLEAHRVGLERAHAWKNNKNMTDIVDNMKYIYDVCDCHRNPVAQSIERFQQALDECDFSEGEFIQAWEADSYCFVELRTKDAAYSWAERNLKPTVAYDDHHLSKYAESDRLTDKLIDKGVVQSVEQKEDTGSRNYYKDIVPGYEYMDLMEHILGYDGVVAHLRGQVFKYLLRFGGKDDASSESVKVMWYSKRLNEVITRNQRGEFPITPKQ